ncbi:TolB family protein [Paenibacillus sp. GCM10027628]|uniref:TolB family protein n=1 Tax=Paenibacillus sp. GCM10027628 TaxID=3273413 RepID=UPI003629A8BF
MNIWTKVTLLLAISMFASAGAASVQASKPEKQLTAAFVRNGDLWIKTGETEKQLTKGETIRYPKWSFDGKWIAYTRGENEKELWVWNVPTGETRLVRSGVDKNYQWAPTRDHLAFEQDQQLYEVDPAAPEKPDLVVQDISNFSWLPDGSGFLASSGAKLLPDGWTPVRILKIPLTAKGDPSRFETLYVLPKQSDAFFAVGTSVFKWSATGQWIAFLATPTASLSADSNTLCTLSSDGSQFKTIGQMANNDQWFQWADEGETLAYIGGPGREGTSNKQLKVTNVPQAAPIVYTPAGYVDVSFTWVDSRTMIASRAKEAEWTGDTAKRQLPFLVQVKLNKQRQKQLTSNSHVYGDFNPISLPFQRLAWVSSDRSTAKVTLAGRSGHHAVTWIENLTIGDSYYEQWDWRSVLSFYMRTQKSPYVYNEDIRHRVWAFF